MKLGLYKDKYYACLELSKQNKVYDGVKMFWTAD